MLKILTILFAFSLCGLAEAKETEKNKSNALIGIYIINIDNINVKDQTFYAEFYLNIKWKGNTTAKNFEFINSKEINRSFYSEWKEGGYNYITCKVRGTFWCEMDVHRYPFDKQKLKLLLSDYAYTIDSIMYTKDDTVSGISKNIKIVGWKINNEVAKICKVNELDSTFPCYDFEIDIERLKSVFILKILIPILIVLCAAYLSLFLPKKIIEAGISLASTALLSLIAFYFSISGSLPDVDYATKFDVLMIGSYTFILTTLGEVVWVNYFLRTDKKWSAFKTEKNMRIFLPLVYLFLLVILTIW